MDAAVSGAVIQVAGILFALFISALIGLVLKRVSEIDAKLDRHIEQSTEVRADVRVLQDRWEREKQHGI